METDPFADRPEPGRPRLKRRVLVFILLAGAVMGPLSGRFTNWLVTRYGMSSDAAVITSSMLIVVVIMCGSWPMRRRVRAGRQAFTGPGARWREAETALAWERRGRPWLVPIMAFMLVRTLVERIRVPIGAPVMEDGLAITCMFVCFALSVTSYLVRFRKSARLPQDEGVQAELRDALRDGYLVLVALGGANMMVASVWPLVAVRAWVPTLMLGVFVPWLRLILLDRTAARGVPLGNSIEKARLERGLTQVGLAERIGVSRRTIDMAERSVFLPSVALAMALSRALETSVEALFFLKENG